MPSSVNDEPQSESGSELLISKPPWQRLLWKKQPYPDNYVPDSFLDGLRTNSSIHLPPLRSIIVSSLPISLQFSLIMNLISVFYHLRFGTLDASELLFISLSLLLAGWISLFIIQSFALSTVKARSVGIKPMRLHLKFSYILLPLILLALSPVLRTLTEATTDDSIWALSSILFFTNWSLADYTDLKASALKFKSKTDSDGYQVQNNLVSASNPISSPTNSSRKASFPPKSPVDPRGFSNKNDRISNPSKSNSSQTHLLPLPLPTGPSLPPTPPPLPSSLSLNASISASVVLASRLSSSFQVFTLIFFSAILFAGVPRWRTKVLELSLIESLLESSSSSNCNLQKSPSLTAIPINRDTKTTSTNRDLSNKVEPSSKNQPSLNLNLNLFLKVFPPLLSISISLSLLSTISKQVTLLSFMVVAFISLICPIWMKWAQRWKNEMRGPWDVGIIRVRS